MFKMILRKPHRPDRLHHAWLAIAAFLITAISTPALAIDFQVEFVHSPYAAEEGDTFADLIEQYAAGTLIQSSVAEGLEDISTTEFAAGEAGDYGVLLTTMLTFTEAGTFTFQMGTDGDQGGAAGLINNSTGEYVLLSDTLGWNNNGSRPDALTLTVTADAGDSYTLAWVGFEGCCGGSMVVTFSPNGVTFAADNANRQTLSTVPEPSTALLLGLGLMALPYYRAKSTA